MIRNKAGKAFNGSKVELCPVCDEAFTGTRAGDMHLVIECLTGLVSDHVVPLCLKEWNALGL